MTPYRPLPVLPERKPMAVCAWCRHFKLDGQMPYGSPRCRANTNPDPVYGPAPKRCDETNPFGKCPDYQPTLFTRLAWWRRAWL